jgi:NAD(P)-dependent dehydrogenase (short-subunit alcohol dehydrogenase family)
MVNFRLDGKIALITGASRGIGESIAQTLAHYGAHTILVSRKIDALEDVAKKIRESGGRADALACHMGEVTQIEGLFKQVREKFGRLDILVNNAATNPYFGDMLNADEGIWDKTFDVNLKGPFFMIKFGAALMAESGGGSILNVSSVNGIRPAMMQGIYSVTKAGLISMTRAFAKELAGRKIRVNALLPGLTDTKFSKALMDNKGIYDYVVNQVPLGRHAEPDEMAGAALYLVSEASSYTTGSIIVVDGGGLA